jgi:hypothetical protein
MASEEVSKRSCQSSPKVTIKNGFPTGRRAAALAGICESPRQSFDQIRRLLLSTYADFSESKNTNKKAHFLICERLEVLYFKGLVIAKAGLVALAVIYYALCKLTSKSAQYGFYLSPLKMQALSAALSAHLSLWPGSMIENHRLTE